MNPRCELPMYPFLSHLVFTTKPTKTMGQPGRALERHKGGMVDDWGQSTPGKTATPPNLRRESGRKKRGDRSGIYGIHTSAQNEFDLNVFHMIFTRVSRSTLLR